MVDEKDVEMLKDARESLTAAMAVLAAVWERHGNVKSDATGAVTAAPEDGEPGSDAPQEVSLAMSSVGDAVDFIDEMIGG